MSEGFKKVIDDLYKGKEKKLSDFEYNQLVCLNSIMSSLVGIEDHLGNINISLNDIKYKVDLIALKKE